MFMDLQGGFVILDIVFGCDNPYIEPQSCRGIKFAHSIFRHYNLAVLRFGEAMQGGLTKHGLVCEEWRPHV